MNNPPPRHPSPTWTMTVEGRRMWPAPDPGNPRPEGGCLIGSPVLQQASGTALNAADSRARVHALATGARFRPRLALDNRCQEHQPEFADLYFIVVGQYG